VSALALRDLMLIRKERSAWVAAAIALSIPFLFAWKSGFAIAMLALPSYYVAAWACGMDFKYRSDRFLCSLPVPRAVLVAHRFAGSLVSWIASFAVSTLGWIAASALGGASMAALPTAALLSLAATMIVVGIYLAAYYVFGYQNARWAIILIIGVGGAVAGALGAALPGSAGSAAQGASSPAEALGSLLAGEAGTGVYAWSAIAALAVFAAAYLVSVAAYRKKEF
jgi:hypothetical protein